MKKLSRIITAILVTVATTGGCEAKDFAVMPNQNGGVITLGDTPCADVKGWFAARTQSQAAGTQYGCWTGYDGKVLALWGVNGGMIPAMYPTNAFVKVRQE